jgi:Fe-S cluster assembly protein SufB
MTSTEDLDLGKYKLGWSDAEDYVFKPKRGLDEDLIREMAWMKGEPDWMRDSRLRSLKHFERRPMPSWGGDMSEIFFDDIFYYIKPTAGQVDAWEELPESVKATYEKLGIPEAERKYLAGVTAQYECLRGSTQVWTTDGLRAITELEAGDRVFSLDERTSQVVEGLVVGTARSGDKEVFEVTAGGRTIGASGNHPFLVLADGAARWVAVDDLKVGDVVAVAHEPASGTTSASASSVAVLERVLPTVAFAPVSSITSVGVEPTYDIEVEGHHNFVADGFVVHNSEVVYHRNREDLEQQGVIFCDMDTALREHPEIVKKWFGKVIPSNDNKFSALNSAVWSGGSFIYIPEGVKVDLPLQAYFRINAENMGQFERTLIIADKGSQVHYIEGCSAPVYTSDSLHSAVVEIVVGEAARVTYTTIQNWSNNVFNLVTKRARVEAEGHMEWIDGNIGSRLTMKYPGVVMVGPKASGEVLSVAYAGAGQHQDTGAKMVHAAPETSSTIISKSISSGGGRTSYRGLVHVDPGATNSKSFVRCDALILDDESRSDTYPYMEVGEQDAQIGHEATVSKIGDKQLFYLMSRGLSEQQAMSMIVNGFIEPITRTLPMEYAVEWSRLIELQMEGSVG